MKVILNAESFGFGPSASIASIFDEISKSPIVQKISYIGSGHSLDLQKKLDYSKIYDVSERDFFQSIVKEYDLFITAMDVEKADWISQTKTKIVFYDALLWYWKSIPPFLKRAELYLAQDFYNVKRTKEKMGWSNMHIVSPSFSIYKDNNLIKDTVLINFGGLQNPFWNIDVTVQYIDKMLVAILPLLHNKKVVIVGSQAHVNKLPQYNMANLPLHEVQNIIQKSELIFATPGLGNIYEIAQSKSNCILLPPANDSQGQQVNILSNEEMISVFVDWNMMGFNIDYFLKQEEVLSKIKKAIGLIDIPQLQGELKKQMSKACPINFNLITNMSKNVSAGQFILKYLDIKK